MDTNNVGPARARRGGPKKRADVRRRFQVPLDDRAYEQLEALAAKHYRSMAGEIMAAIDEHLKRHATEG